MYSAGASSTPVPTVHRWSPAPRWSGRGAARAADAEQRAWLRAARARRIPVSRRQMWVAAAIVLLLHAFGWQVLTHHGAWVPARAPHVERQVLQVVLIDSPPPVAPVPAPALPQALPDMRVRAPQAAVAPLPSAPPPVAEKSNRGVTAARLFDDEGRVLLPAPVSSAKSTTAFHAGNLDARDRPAQPQSPIDYHPTKLEKFWVPEDENLWQKAARETTLSGTVLRIGGTEIKCAVAPLALGFACVPSPPDQLSAPLKVEFKRNNLPTATPLITPARTASSALPAPPASVASPARASSE